MRVYDPFNPTPRRDPFPEDVATVKQMAEELLLIIERDRRKLQQADDYLHGVQADPYMPDDADAEYRLLAERSKTNYMDLVVTSVAQQMYVDSFRAGDGDDDHDSKSWKHWQRSGLDARQLPLYRGSFTFGHAFTITEAEEDGKARTRVLSPRKTAAIYEDVANDLTPVAALTIHRPQREVKQADGSYQTVPGTALMWTATDKFAVKFVGCSVDLGTVTHIGAHGASSCPVTRFACDVDLDGRTQGLIIPLIPLQDRINQSVLDLLVVQSGGAFKVRTISGMVPPPMKRAVWQTDENGERVLDEDGQPIVDHWIDVINPNTGQPMREPIQANAKRWMFAASPETKFGQLDETPLSGYIESIDMSIRHLSSVTQMPPDYLLGQVANLSAEALQAAERALTRKVAEFQTAFGEAWERVFRLAAELEGDTKAANDDSAEVTWRDQDKASLSKVADAFGKLRQNVNAPAHALWRDLPGMTQQKYERWLEDAESEDEEAKLNASLNRLQGPGAADQESPQQPKEDVNVTTSSRPPQGDR